MVKPTFFILGAAKAGTTSLYHYLKMHPDVYMSEPKETVFFEAEYELGLQYYSKKYFPRWSGQSQIGEARHRNLFLPYVPARIKESCPEAKFVVLVRNPVDRAYSHWWYWYSIGVENDSFRDAIKKNFARLSDGPFFDTEAGAAEYIRTLDRNTGFSPYPTYIDSGYYAQQIERYIKLFGRDSLFVIESESMFRGPENIIGSVFRFLDLQMIPIDNLRKHNSGRSYVDRRIAQIAKYFPLLRRFPDSVKHYVRAGGNRVIQLGRPAMDEDIRGILNEHFSTFNRDLERLLGVKFDTWS